MQRVLNYKHIIRGITKIITGKGKLKKVGQKKEEEVEVSVQRKVEDS